VLRKLPLGIRWTGITIEVRLVRYHSNVQS
jgi:hypothetical protein